MVGDPETPSPVQVNNAGIVIGKGITAEITVKLSGNKMPIGMNIDLKPVKTNPDMNNSTSVDDSLQHIISMEPQFTKKTSPGEFSDLESTMEGGLNATDMSKRVNKINLVEDYPTTVPFNRPGTAYKRPFV